MQQCMHNTPFALVSEAVPKETEWLTAWETHLQLLEQAGLISLWSPLRLAAGAGPEAVGREGCEPEPLLEESASPDSTDADLVEQAAACNERAFELLVERYQTQVKQFVSQHLARTEEVEDIVQFVFLKLYLFLPRLQGHLISTRSQHPLKSWLLQVALNRCRDEHRRLHPCLFSEVETVTEEEHNLLESIPDAAPLPEETVEQQERQKLIHHAIEALPRRSRAIVSLRYQEDLTFREIEERLHLPENTARTYFQRALPLLRAALVSLET